MVFTSAGHQVISKGFFSEINNRAKLSPQIKEEISRAMLVCQSSKIYPRHSGVCISKGLNGESSQGSAFVRDLMKCDFSGETGCCSESKVCCLK